MLQNYPHYRCHTAFCREMMSLLFFNTQSNEKRRNCNLQITTKYASYMVYQLFVRRIVFKRIDKVRFELPVKRQLYLVPTKPKVKAAR